MKFSPGFTPMIWPTNVCICNKVKFWPENLFILNKLVFLFLSLHNDLLHMWLDWKVATELFQNHLTLQHWRKTSRYGCTKLEKKNNRTRTKQYQWNKTNSLAGCCMNSTYSLSLIQRPSIDSSMSASNFTITTSPLTSPAPSSRYRPV
jgi:hypothetical protein